MSKRIRQLEDALNIAHSSKPSNVLPHPLLREELLSLKVNLDYSLDNDDEDPRENKEEEEDLSVSLGTLSISHAGQSFFEGRAGSEVSFLSKPKSQLTDD